MCPSKDTDPLIGTLPGFHNVYTLSEHEDEDVVTLCRRSPSSYRHIMQLYRLCFSVKVIDVELQQKEKRSQ